MSLSTRNQAAFWAIGSGILAVVSGVLLQAFHWNGPMRVLLCLIPVLPMIWHCVLAVRLIRLMDELQARIQLEGAVYGLLGTAVFTMAAGLLMKGQVIPSVTLAQGWPWLWIATFLFWCAGSRLAGQRYR